MNTFSTITEFLNKTGTQYRVFDLGRRISGISAEDFLLFENNQAAYPYPLQQHAWMGILCWNEKNPENHFVWFLKFPLDELAQLSPVARDDFLYQIIESIGENMLAEANGIEAAADSRENPYGFTPKQETMAVFHAKALKILGLPVSQFYTHAQEYFSGKLGYEQWSFVGLQGIADICVHLEEEDNTGMLLNALPELPAVPFTILCQCMENEDLPPTLVNAVISRVRNAIQSPEADVNILVAGIRALAMTTATELRQGLIREILDSDFAGNVEILAAIAGRCWQDLKDAELCHQYMESLAQNEHDQSVFNLINADLMFIPGMREIIMQEFRNPQRSTELSSAIGAMFNDYRT